MRSVGRSTSGGDAVSLSIILAVHNGRAFMPQVLSRLEQELTLLPGSELVIVDDASTDGSAEFLRTWAARLPRVRVIGLPVNEGVSRARQHAIEAAAGEFVWIVDVDDEWTVGAGKRLVGAAQGSGADVVVCRAVRSLPGATSRTPIDGLDAPLVLTGGESITLVWRGEIHGYLWNKVIRRALLADADIPPLTSQSDFLMASTALARAGKVQFIPDVLYTHLTQVDSITRRKNPDLQNLLVCREFLADLCAEHGYVVESELQEYFTAWFCVLPMARTPTRLRSDPDVVQSWMSRALELSKETGRISNFRCDWSVLVGCFGIQLLRHHYPRWRSLLRYASRIRNRSSLPAGPAEQTRIEIDPS